MKFGEAVCIWRLRRGLTAGLIALVLAAFLGAVAWLPRSYQSQASVVLLPSQAASAANGGNPYLSFTPSITQTADIVSREMMSPRTARRLAAGGCTESYVVGLDPDTAAGPVLDVAVTGGDPGLVERALAAVVAQISVALSAIQGRVRPKSRIRVAELSWAPQATLAVSDTARPVVLVAVFGLVIALGCPVVVDGLSRRRRARHQATTRPRPADQARRLADG